MLCKRYGLCSLRNQIINILWGEGTEGCSKTFINWILLPHASTLLLIIVPFRSSPFSCYIIFAGMGYWASLLSNSQIQSSLLYMKDSWCITSHTKKTDCCHIGQTSFNCRVMQFHYSSEFCSCALLVQYPAVCIFLKLPTEVKITCKMIVFLNRKKSSVIHSLRQLIGSFCTTRRLTHHTTLMWWVIY